jgi:hypothetical protein
VKERKVSDPGRNCFGPEGAEPDIRQHGAGCPGLVTECDKVTALDLERELLRDRRSTMLGFAPGRLMYSSGAWTPNSHELIYTSDRGDSRGICKLALDGSAPQSVSTSVALDAGVARLSPDGSWIVFNGRPRGGAREAAGVYRVPVDGGVAQLLFEAKYNMNLDCSERTAHRCVYDSSPQGAREVIFTSFDPVAGKGKELFRTQVDVPGENYGWMLSPDGSQVGLVRLHGNPHRVEFFPLHGGPSRSVEIRGPYASCTSVGWASDSQSVFVGVEDSHSAALLRVGLNGNTQPIWAQGHNGAMGGSPSPDGRRLAIGTTGFNKNVWMIDNF